MSATVRFSVVEYDRMIEAGIFADRPDQRLELILGEIREVPPAGPQHEDVVDLLNYWSVDQAPRDQVRVRVQNSLGIPSLDSVPQPDIAWMRARSYRQRRPEPEDVLLLIEVAASSLATDRGEKSRLYAEAGVREYWIVNLIDLCIEVHHEPRNGQYKSVVSFQIGDAVQPLSFPDCSLDVSRLFSS